MANNNKPQQNQKTGESEGFMFFLIQMDAIMLEEWVDTSKGDLAWKKPISRRGAELNSLYYMYWLYLVQ